MARVAREISAGSTTSTGIDEFQDPQQNGESDEEDSHLEFCSFTLAEEGTTSLNELPSLPHREAYDQCE